MSGARGCADCCCGDTVVLLFVVVAGPPLMRRMGLLEVALGIKICVS